MKNNNDLEGKVAIISGASKGLGAGIAKAFAQRGATVVVNYNSDKLGAEKVVLEIQSTNGKALAIRGDVAKSEDVSRLFLMTKETFGRIDIVVNNAAAFSFGPIEALTEEEFHRQFNTNVLGALWMSREAVKYFDEKGGNIINITGTISENPYPYASTFAGTKAAVEAISVSLSRELAHKNIRVNTVAPGLIETKDLSTIDPDQRGLLDKIIAETPMGRIGQIDDIVKAIAFVASDNASWITGERISVGGGLK